MSVISWMSHDVTGSIRLWWEQGSKRWSEENNLSAWLGSTGEREREKWENMFLSFVNWVNWPFKDQIWPRSDHPPVMRRVKTQLPAVSCHSSAVWTLRGRDPSSPGGPILVESQTLQVTPSNAAFLFYSDFSWWKVSSAEKWTHHQSVSYSEERGRPCLGDKINVCWIFNN